MPLPPGACLFTMGSGGRVLVNYPDKNRLNKLFQ